MTYLDLIVKLKNEARKYNFEGVVDDCQIIINQRLHYSMDLAIARLASLYYSDEGAGVWLTDMLQLTYAGKDWSDILDTDITGRYNEEV